MAGKLYRYIYSFCLQKIPFKMSDLIKRRDEILREIAEIDRMQRGRLSKQFFKVMKDGNEVLQGPYYVLQRWCGGKNVCQRVPAKDVESVQSAIEGHERFEKLTEQFVEITERLTREMDQDKDKDAKKNATKSARRNSRKPKPS